MNEDENVVPNSAFKRYKEIIKQRMVSIKVSHLLMILGVVFLVFVSSVSTLIATLLGVNIVTIGAIVITATTFTMALGAIFLILGFLLYDKNK